MALNFPSSPSINDTYTYGDKTWVWNGRFWQIQAAGAINDIAIGNITPNTGAFTTLTATGNITAQGNVQGQYILGNGAFLTGISGSSTYGNANVANYLPNYGGNISTNVVSGNFYANSILPWSPTAGLINDAVDIGNSTLSFRDIYVGNVITPAGDQGNATQIQPASGVGESGVAFVDAITGSAADVSAGTLYVESIDAIGNVTVDTFVEANEIIALSNVSGTGGNFSANVTAAYFLGNGAFLTGISAGSSYSNANVAAYLPNYQGLISNVDFRSTSPAAVAMVVTDRPITIGGNTYSYITIPNDGNANSVATELTNHGLGNVLISSGPDDHEWIFDNTGNLTAPGNIQAGNAVSANYFLGNGALLTGITTNYSNANVANYLATYNGNALFSNVTVSQDAVILGNLRVEGNTTYINVSDLIVEDKDIIVAANANATMTDLNGAGLQIGNRSAGGNITFFYNSTSNVMTLSHGANIANVLNVAGNITATGNVNTGNLVGSGTNVEIVGGSYTWTFNGSGNLVLPGNTFAVNYANGTQVALAGSYSNTNVKAYLGNFDGNIIPSANITYDLGSNSNRWNDLYLNNSTIYIGAQEITANADSTIFSGNISVGNLVGTGDNVDIKAGAYTWRFDNAGNLTLPANTSAINYANGATVPVGYGNASVAAYLGSNANLTILSQGNITGNYFIGNGALLTGVVTSSYSNANVANYLPTYTGNIAAGNVTATGNVQGAYILGNGALLTGLPATYGNSNVAAYLASNANVTLAIGTGNITTQGNLAVGNLIGSGDNVDLKAGSYTWRFDSTGNLTLPANSTAIYYANGTQVPVGYGNANVATYLASNSAVTILTTANITTAANISGAYILGNGALLTGLPATYGNSNVAAYLAAYNGNALFSNITVSQDAVVLGNLRVEGNTTYINVSDLIVEDKDIIVAANASATMTDLNGAGLQIGNRTSGGNITFFYNSTSNVMSLSHGANIANVLNVAGNISATGNVSGNWFVGNINTTNSLVTSGNVTANNFLGSGSNVTLESDSYSWIFDNAGNLTLPGNTFAVNYANGTQISLGGSYSNSIVANYLASNANLTISVGTGNITTQGNITGNYFIGNGALLTGVVTSSYSNANVANYLPTYTGNISAGNITATGNVTANGFIGSNVNTRIISSSYIWTFNNTGNLVLPGNTFGVTYANGTTVSLGGTYSNADVANYLPTYTGNITAGNVIATGNVIGNWFVGNVNTTNSLVTSGNVTANNFVGSGNNVTLASDSYTWTFDNTGNFILPGNNTAIYYANGTQVPVGYGNANVATYLQAYNANALFSNVTVSRDILILGNLRVEGNTTEINVSNIFLEDKDIIVAANANATLSDLNGAGLQIGNRTAGGNITFFYNSISNVMSLSHGANIANVLNVAGNIVATGNVTGNYILGNGAFLTGLPATYGNSNVAAYLASNTNIILTIGTGNITTQGNIAVGNLIGSGNNVEITAGAYTWTLDNTGNLTLPGNTTAIYYANGTQVPVGYGNANVATYLASNANVTVSVGVSNITTQGNVSGNYFIGNGALLTGVVTSSYSNANVANYLPTYTGNVSAGNLNLTGNIVDTGAIFVITGSNGNVVLAPSGTSRIIATTSGANVIGNLDVAGNVNANGATLTGNLAVGNLIGSGDNVEITAGAYTWTLDNTGNLILPGNATAIYYANGTQVPVGYGNTNVATYLASNAAVTILTTANITTAANISGAYILGNGAFLSGLPATYGNSNVAAYLAAYNGNALFSNITVSQDAVILGNLRVEGNTTYINVTDLIVEDKDIIVAANANATLTDLNGAGLQIGNRSAGGNITFFYDSTSNVMSLSHGANIANILNVAGNVTATGNVNTGNLVGSGTNVEIVSGAYTWTFDGAGNLTGTGNVSAGNFVGTAGNTSIVTANYTWTFNNAGNLVLPGNTFGVTYANGTTVSLGGSYSNADVANYLPTFTGNVGAGNLNITGNIVDTGALNIITGASGNITLAPGNSNVLIARTTGANITGTLGVTGNITGGNITTTIVSATGNVSGGNIITTGVVTATGNITGGNIVTTGIVSATGNVNASNLNVTGNIVDTGALNIITGASGNVSLAPNNTSVLVATTTGVNVSGTFNATGSFITAGNVTANNLIGTGVNTSIVSNNYTWTFNSEGNFVLPGNTFGVTYANGTAVSLGGSYGNADVANYLPTYTGNITAGNITTTGNITTNNFIGSSGNTSIVTAGYTWVFDNAGNLVLPGNSFSVNYANGTAVSLGGSYSNADVGSYLQTYNGNALFSNVTISQDAVILGNLRVQGNTTYINVTDLVIEDKDIIVAANATATLTDLNGAGLQIGNRSSGGNITFFYNSTSNVMSLSHGANIANVLNVAGNVSAGNFIGTEANTSIVANNYTWTFNSAGNFVLPSNTFSINYANGTAVSLSGSYSNADVANYLPTYTGNLVSLAGNVTTTGNITGNYFIGNGALLTGVVTSSYSNANVADYLASNANINLTIGTGNITTQGNISVGSIQGSNANTTIVANVYSWTFDDTGNLTLPGNSTAIYLANGTQVPLGYNNASVADYMGSNANVTLSIGTGNITTQGNIKSRTLYLGSHQDVSYQAYGNITLSGGSADNNSNVSIVANGAMTTSYVLKLPADTPNAGDVLTVKNFGSQLLFGNVANLIWSAPAGSYTNANVANYLVTYNANALFSNVTVSQDAVILGNLRVEGNTTYINVSDLIVEDKDIIVAANASATLTDLNGAGLQIGNRSAGGNITFFYDSTSNVMSLSHGANIANVLNVAGNITANSLVGIGTNVELVGGSYTWTFNGSGNLVLPGNTFSVNYANGAQVSLGGSYSNAEVASYLASNANVTILTGVANITTQGNVTAGYFLGNATFAEGVSNTYFGNVSPSSPAQGDIWINSDTAAQLIYFVDANGGQWAEMAADTSISVTGNYTNSNVTALLASLGANTISSSANITTTANIQGDYILGNGYFLSGITGGSSYGNANVANYLPTYTGNITAGNISVTGNVAANYIIGNGSQISNLTFANIDQFATAGLTVDELYLQAVTRLGVTASGASGYVFDQYGAGLNPVLYATSGETIAFNLNVAGHPFLIQTSGGSNYSSGLVHITTTGTVTTGASAQGQIAGTLYWQVPYGITGNYKYQCSIHGGMQNAIVISDGNVANLTVSSAATANTVTTAAQPNITSVGNLTSLIVTGNITGNTNGFTIGYRDVPQVSWSNATMALADAGKHYYTSTGGVTLTVPSNANVTFPIGATIAFYNRSSANCTIAPQASVNIFLVGNSTITPTANRTITSNGGGTLTKVDTNTWMLSAANVV